MTLFEFAVRYLRPLARIPGLPQLFDTGLLAWTSLFDRPRLAAMEAVEAAALALPEVKPRVHRLGGLGFAARGCEFAHLHGNGLLDVRVGRKGARELIAMGCAQPHHVFDPSAWISLWICSPSDLPRAIHVLQTAHAGLVTAGEVSEENVTSRIIAEDSWPPNAAIEPVVNSSCKLHSDPHGLGRISCRRGSQMCRSTA